MDEMSDAKILKYLKSLVRESYNAQYFLGVLEQLEKNKSTKTIRNAEKLLDGTKKIEYGRVQLQIYVDELKNILFGDDSKEVFYNFVRRVYGTKAEKLLRDAGVTVDDINTFSIFKNGFIDKVEEYGINFKEIIRLKINSEEMLDNYMVLSELKERYKDNPEFTSVLEELTIGTKDSRRIMNAEKILKNKRIVQNINADILSSIINGENNSYKNICEVVGKTYGKEAEEILRERPQIKMRDIPNFDIFDENIREMIGYGGVHTFLTYYMDSDSVISYIADNPELARHYKAFEDLTHDYFPPSACGLEDRLIAFYENEDLIKQIIDSGNGNSYKEKLMLYFQDRENLCLLSSKAVLESRWQGRERTFFPEKDFNIQTLEELDKYYETREALLKKYGEEDKSYKKSLIQFKYFGRLAESISDTRNMEKFLNDYVRLNQTNITNEELDLIELFLIFKDIEDEKVLEDLDKLLSQRRDVITPLNLRTINCKIAENYKKEYLDSLVSVEKARKMSEESETILDSKTDSIQRNEASQNLSRRYILKNNDDNVYYSDHMETPDGVKKYRDCVVIQKDNATIYTFMYRCQDGEEILKRVIREKDSKGNFSEQIEYKMGDIGFSIDNGEIKGIYPKGKKEHLENFIKTYKQRIDEATLIQQYNPEEKFKIEKDDVEGFVLRGIHYSEICVSLIRKGDRPTSDEFSYGGLDRI